MSKREELGLKSPADLLKAISTRAPDAGMKLQRMMNELNFEVVLNQARTLKDVELGPSIQGVCTKYFGMPFNYLGHVEHDNAVWQALRKRRHLIYEYPHSKVYAQMMSITRRWPLLSRKRVWYSNPMPARNEDSSSYYDVLELNPNASGRDVHTAYLRAKETYSPDSPALYTMFTPDEARQLLKMIDEAFTVLSNQAKRQEYDLSLARKGHPAFASLLKAKPTGRAPQRASPKISTCSHKL